MSFGSCLGQRKIVAQMLAHSQAQQRLSPLAQQLAGQYGHWMVRLCGYPLAVGIRQRARAVLQMLDPQPGERILDVGCGIGYYVFELATRFRCKAYGIDLDAEDVRLAGRMKKDLETDGAQFGVAEGGALPFATGLFDKVLCSEVIEHVPDDVRFLGELGRVLRSGGTLVITTPWAREMTEYDAVDMTIHYAGLMQGKTNLEQERAAHHGHVRNGYTVQALRERLAQSGLTMTGHRQILKRYSNWGIRLGMAAFPLGYSVAMLDNFLPEEGSCLVCTSRKNKFGKGS
ncbi:MAG: methyltransferase domain-containing protein [Chloroflexi bacterium]|nr:methyltransferase domain-containing protein [Chloroflexota bacterium]